ncbi:AHH domain-containing protein [Aneurinibacillus migulanus]|uniref:AHH domain-containing protein n=1 Tax=Aneurinibacillus migulanus TaxID=47500 RepID=UPI0006B65562|nr:AHH domain-containing protein [Aneurinibacillus migulanus]
MNRANRELAKKEGYMNRAWCKGKGSAAYHVVAGDDPRAQPARDILAHYKIDINSADNGFILNT